MAGVLLVTGAGRGMGAAMAKQGAKRGYKVAVNYARSAERAKAVVAEIERASGQAIAVKADVGSEAEVVEMFRTVDRELGRLTALVNNPGVMEPSPAVSLSGDAVTALFRTHTTRMFVCIRAAARRMPTALCVTGVAIVDLTSITASRRARP